MEDWAEDSHRQSILHNTNNMKWMEDVLKVKNINANRWRRTPGIVNYRQRLENDARSVFYAIQIK